MDQLNETEQQILKALKTIETRLDEEQRSPTTEEIIEAIGDLGQTKYDVCAGKCKPKFDNQWLYDLVWYENDGHGQLISIPLVAESELKLSLEDHKVDFEKLLISNAENKLFICRAYTDDISQRFAYFQDGINKYALNKAGDSYLIVIFDYYTHKISFRKLSKQASNN